MLQQNCRSEDVICRFGGDEFMILLLETGLEDAKKFTVRLMEATSSLKLEAGDTKLDFIPTISIGVATYNGEDNLDHQKLIEISDKALYNSKNKGRDCASFYEWGTSSDYDIVRPSRSDYEMEQTPINIEETKQVLKQASGLFNRASNLQ